MSTAINEFSSASTMVSDRQGLHRSNIHIVFTVAPTDPTHLLLGGASYSFDGGRTWEATGTEVYYEQHIDWVIENHGRKDWEELLASSGRIVSDRADPNYNFDVYYDKVHSEIVSQLSSRSSDLPTGWLDS